MTAARLLLDEMLSPNIADQLIARGHDVVTVTQRPDLMALRDDEPLLAAATAETRTIVTVNIGDFAALDIRWSAESREHAGIVFVATASFPQDRRFIAAVVRALGGAADNDALPGKSRTLYLRPAP